MDEARAGDVMEGLQHSGMVVAAVPDQLNALTAADKAQLTTAWKGGGLLALTWQRAQYWVIRCVQAVASTKVPAWSAADSDSVAGDLGGTSYAALSPGLKSVVQRVATIVTGDTKPVMPDDGWSTWMTPTVRAGFDARPDQRFDWSAVSQTPPGVSADPGSQVTTQCDAGPALNWLCHATQAAAGAVVATVDFVTNPLGYLAAAFSAAAAGMMTFVATVANHGTAPDLTASWWVSAYTKGMAIGMVLLGFVLLVEIVQVARRRSSGQDLLETVSIWLPAWFAGVLFGPPVAQFLITGAGYLSDGIVSSMTGYGAGDAFTAVAQATRDGAQVQQVGELVMALLTAIAVLVSALLVFISLCVQAVILYLASAVFAVGWVWIITARHRDTAWRIPRLFIGVVFSKALLFFLLGVAMAIAAASTAMTGDGIAKNLGSDRDGLRGDAAGRVHPADPAQARPGDPRHQHLPGHRRHHGRRRRGRAGPRPAAPASAVRGGQHTAHGASRLAPWSARSRHGGGTVIGAGERPSRTPPPADHPTTGTGTGARRRVPGRRVGRRRAPPAPAAPTPPAPRADRPGPAAPGRPAAGRPAVGRPATGRGAAGPGRRRPAARAGRPAAAGAPGPRTRCRGSTPAHQRRTWRRPRLGRARRGWAPRHRRDAAASTSPSASWRGAASTAPTPARGPGAWQSRLARAAAADPGPGFPGGSDRPAVGGQG